MPSTKSPRVLVVVVGTTRAWELCWESVSTNLLDELDADLALCLGDRDQGPNPFYERAKYIWETHEPDDWAEAYDEAAGDSSWRALLRPGDHLFGGITSTEHPQPGLAALVVYVRYFLKQCLDREGITKQYDWVILTRSDFLWPIPHPDVRLLSDRRIYTFDGEQYGGLAFRHLIIPRRHADRVLSLYDAVFDDAERLADRLDRWRMVMDWWILNLERFQLARMCDLGLWRELRFLGYVPFTVRARGGPTAWSIGTFDDELGAFVKYPLERQRSQIARRFIPDGDAWDRYLAPVRGSVVRWRLRRAYRRRELYDRPFPVSAAPRRGYRWTKLGLLDVVDRGRRAQVPVGRALRRLPGASALLDARIRRIEGRVESPADSAAD
jgi:hypothetical protein